MRLFDEFTRTHSLSEAEMRHVKAGELYYYKITCPDGKTYMNTAEVDGDEFWKVVDEVFGEGATGGRAIFC